MVVPLRTATVMLQNAAMPCSRLFEGELQYLTCCLDSRSRYYIRQQQNNNGVWKIKKYISSHAHTDGATELPPFVSAAATHRSVTPSFPCLAVGL